MLRRRSSKRYSSRMAWSRKTLLIKELSSPCVAVVVLLSVESDFAAFFSAFSLSLKAVRSSSLKSSTFRSNQACSANSPSSSDWRFSLISAVNVAIVSSIVGMVVKATSIRNYLVITLFRALHFLGMQQLFGKRTRQHLIDHVGHIWCAFVQQIQHRRR